MAEVTKRFYRYSTFLQRIMELFDDGSVMYSEIESKRRHLYSLTKHYDEFVKGMNELYKNGCIDIYTEIYNHIKDKAEQDVKYRELLEECRIKNNEIARNLKTKNYLRKIAINSSFEDSSKTYVKKQLILLKAGKVKYMEIREDGDKNELSPTDYENFIAHMDELFEAGNYDIYDIVFLHIKENARNDNYYAMLNEYCEAKINELATRFEEIPSCSEATKQQTWIDSLKVADTNYTSENIEPLKQVQDGKSTYGRE